MNIKDPEYWRKAAKGHADTISKTLWAGLLIAITTILLRFTGGNTLKVYGVDIPLDRAWIPLAAFTVFHLTFTMEFLRTTRRYWELTEPKEYSTLFRDITTEGGLFMRGMTPRILPETGGPAPMGGELATWLTHASALCLLFALIPSSGFASLAAAPAYIITYANWMIGSQWAIGLSELAVRKEFSTILARRRSRQGEISTVFDEEVSPQQLPDETANHALQRTGAAVTPAAPDPQPPSPEQPGTGRTSGTGR